VCFRFHHRHEHRGVFFGGTFWGPICKPVKECVTPEKPAPCCVSK
jgi:hypothetical protein